MEGSRKSTSSPKPSKTGENNENDLSHHNLPHSNSNKKVVAKHFMSPTISAVSKAAVPRKKVLVDKTENSGSLNRDPKRVFRRSSSHTELSLNRLVSPCGGATYESDDDAYSLGNSSSKPYDPLTNYLSPRPRFLRFDPNKRHEILSRIQKEDLNGSFDSQESNDEDVSSNEGVGNSSFSPTKKSAEKQIHEGNGENEADLETDHGSEDEEETDEEDVEEEEEGEIEGERGWCLRGVLKILFTLIACVLSTSYIDSMNSTSPSPIQPAIWGLKDGYFVVQNQTLEVTALKMQDSGFLVVEEVNSSYIELDEVEIDENVVVDDVSSEAEMIEDHEVELDGHRDGLVQNENDLVDTVDEAEETKGVDVGEFEVKGETLVQLVDANIDESKNTESYGLEKELESCNTNSVEDDAYNMEAEKEEVTEGTEAVSETDDGSNIAAGNSEWEKEVDDSNHLQEELEPSVQSTSDHEVEEAPKDLKGLDSVEVPQELTESHEKSTVSPHEVDDIGYDGEGQAEKPSGWSAALVGVSIVVSVSLVSLAAFFYRSKKASNTSARQSQPSTKPPPSNVEEKLSSLKPVSISSNGEFPIALNHKIHVPTAELIGETVNGGKVSSSARIYDRKTEMAEFEETSSVTIFPKQSSPPQPVSTPNQPSALDFSYATSDSGGSFTSARKTSKKEGSISRKATIEVTTTPLRRSSRLRSRTAAMSP